MEENTDLFNDDLDGRTLDEISGSAKWTRLMGILTLSVVAIAALGMLILWSLVTDLFVDAYSAETAGQMTIVIAVIIVIVLGIVSAMAFLLFRGGKRVITAVQTNDQVLLAKGLTDIKIYFGIYGVFSILGLISNLNSLF